jgi:serine/threonine protein kinase
MGGAYHKDLEGESWTGQGRGKDVDQRTDVWAFGCVLYEMLAGRPAFSAETISDVMVAILDREPAWQQLPPGTRRHSRGC